VDVDSLGEGAAVGVGELGGGGAGWFAPVYKPRICFVSASNSSLVSSPWSAAPELSNLVSDVDRCARCGRWIGRSRWSSQNELHHRFLELLGFLVGDPELHCVTGCEHGDVRSEAFFSA
jgi:hypothetical protein